MTVSRTAPDTAPRGLSLGLAQLLSRRPAAAAASGPAAARPAGDAAGDPASDAAGGMAPGSAGAAAGAAATGAGGAPGATGATRAGGAPSDPPGTGQRVAPVTPRAFSCQCGRPVFFRNSQCLACLTPLGYDPMLRALLPLQAAAGQTDRVACDLADGDSADPSDQSAPPLWQAFAADADAPRYQRCANLGSAAACNWLLPEQDPHAGTPALCRCCRLTRTLPDLSQPEHPLWWRRIELAKRRLVSSLLGLGLPVLSRMSEDPERGLVFDLLRAAPGGPPVVTGHDDGMITLDVAEADDAHREQRRHALGEPYRTLLGHLRHESGHYYWQRLVDGSHWQASYREVFGDERQDYTAALQRHYRDGAPADWGQRFVSAYASSHPWEDWAESWANYLHLVDTLDTAGSFGLDGERVELSYERFGPDLLTEAGHGSADDKDNFLRLINSWMELTGVLNEMSRSMGVPDFYPFVLSAPAVRKLYHVHCVIADTGQQPPAEPVPATTSTAATTAPTNRAPTTANRADTAPGA